MLANEEALKKRLNQLRMVTSELKEETETTPDINLSRVKLLLASAKSIYDQNGL